jgi:lipopolysaccharide transport system permease protein
MNELKWDIVIDGKDKGRRSTIADLWRYKDLLWLLVRRDFVAFYKQTVLGPFWFFVKPIFTTIIYLFIFGKLAGLSTDGIPPILFYLSGLTVWAYFTDNVSNCADVLRVNAGIFGKVYFPRLIMPMSIIFSSMIKLIVQLTLLVVIFLYYLFFSNEIDFSLTILLSPLIILIIALQAAGLGLLVASISVKYRDISMLSGYGLQLGLFLTPIVYPLSSLTGNYKLLILANPMTIPVELFRYSFFGSGAISLVEITYMLLSTIIIFILGLYAFNKTEKTFVDII